MGFVKVGQVLPKVAERSEEREAMEATYIVKLVNTELQNIIGKYAADNVFASQYKNSLLTLSVSSSVWAHHLKMQEITIKKSINELLGESIVKKLSYKVTKQS